MTEKLRVGIVGADAKGQGWAPLAHFPALRALPEFEIGALCTTREETARAAAERYGVPRAYHDYREMFASPESRSSGPWAKTSRTWSGCVRTTQVWSRTRITKTSPRRRCASSKRRTGSRT